MSGQIQIELEKEYKIYFQPVEDAPSFIVDEESLNVLVQFGFDYSRKGMDRNNWLLMLDVELNVEKIASLLYRTEFSVNATMLDLLQDNVMLTMVETAVEQAVLCYHEHCRTMGLEEMPEPEIGERVIKDIMENLKEEIPAREKLWEANKPLHTLDGGSFSTGKKTSVFIQGTFVVMDQLLMLNRQCDITHNREMLLDNIGMDLSRYISLRLHCNSITEHNVELSFFQMIYIFLLVDCAAQVLISPLADVIQEGLEEHGFTAEIVAEYMHVADEIRHQLNSELKSADTSVDLLNKSYDWTSWMR